MIPELGQPRDSKDISVNLAGLGAADSLLFLSCYEAHQSIQLAMVANLTGLGAAS